MIRISMAGPFCRHAMFSGNQGTTLAWASNMIGSGTMKNRNLLIASAAFFLTTACNLSSSVAQTNTAADEAQRILHATGTRGGLIVHLGCGDGKLTAALSTGVKYLVHGLDADPANVQKAREHIQSLGLYGKTSVEQLRSDRLPYADNLANLVVSAELGKVSMDEVMRVLCPYGAAYIKTNGKWTKTVKSWPKEIDEWSHYLHGADNNAVAHDSVVGPPRRMQWLAKPLWLRSHETDSGVSAMVSARGRVYYILDEGLIGIVDRRLPSTWSLIARDAFNGVLLWKQPLPRWGWREWNRKGVEEKDLTVLAGRRGKIPTTLSRRLVADADRVYVTLGYTAPLTALSAATGETLWTCDGTQGTDEILASQGIVVVCIRDPAAEQAKRRGKMIPERIVAIKAESGEVLWDQTTPAVSRLAIAIEGARVFTGGQEGIVCRNLQTGEPIWRTPAKRTRGTFVVHQDVVLISETKELTAYSAQTGQVLWSQTVSSEKGAPRQDLFVSEGLVWRGIGGIGLDLHTGEVKKTVSIENLHSVGHHHRCYRSKATSRFILSAKEGVEFLDIQSNNNSRNNWLRGTCKLGIMPCNGLLYVPPDQCFCEPGVKLLGFCALAPESSNDSSQPSPTDGDRLLRGAAYADIRSSSTTAAGDNQDDWSTFRHDPARSGSTSSVVPSRIKPLWQAALDGKLTQPVVAADTLYVASIDSHMVYALNADDGTPRWHYTAGGRVDSPPTVFKGRVLFGSSDGWVYCLLASNGQLAWRFRAAPTERRIGGYGQLESPWPVHGSVMVQNDVVYFAAGRSSFLDGGIFLFGLDPDTGNVLYQSRVSGPEADLSEGPGQCFWTDGARSEVLVGDGSSIFMRQIQFNNSLAKQPTPYITKLGDQKVGLHLFSTSGLLDDSWYNRSYWMYSARWPGFYHANQAPKSGQLIVFDDATTYAVKVFTRRNRHSPMFFPGQEGYLLFADDNSNEPQLVGYDRKLKPVEWLPQNEYQSSRGITKLNARAEDFDKGVGFTRTKPPKWATWIPVRIQAMVRAAGILFVAGPPDVLDPKDPLAAFEGRRGAELWAVSASDGKKLSELKLDSPPVLDGLIAANRRLYLSTKDGKVTCFGATEKDTNR